MRSVNNVDIWTSFRNNGASPGSISESFDFGPVIKELQHDIFQAQTCQRGHLNYDVSGISRWFCLENWPHLTPNLSLYHHNEIETVP